MDIQNMKNMVILKNLPSNMVEEAFVILKDNVKIHNEKLAKNKSENKNENQNEENRINRNNNRLLKDKDYVIKEAEMIISDYVRNIENEQQIKIPKEKGKLEIKCKRLKYMNVFLTIFLILSVISIVFR